MSTAAVLGWSFNEFTGAGRGPLRRHLDLEGPGSPGNGTTGHSIQPMNTSGLFSAEPTGTTPTAPMPAPLAIHLQETALTRTQERRPQTHPPHPDYQGARTEERAEEYRHALHLVGGFEVAPSQIAQLLLDPGKGRERALSPENVRPDRIPSRNDEQSSSSGAAEKPIPRQSTKQWA